jgi:hypothetical protein
MAHGFIESYVGDLRLIGHGGDTFWFHSMLMMSEKHNVGIFVSTNSQEGGVLPTLTALAFFNRYFPPHRARARRNGRRRRRACAQARRHVRREPARTHGARENRRADERAERGCRRRRRADLPPDFRHDTRSAGSKSSPNVYRIESGHETVVFKQHPHTVVTYFNVPNFSVFVFERLEGMMHPAVAVPMIVGCFLIFVLAPIVWFLRAAGRIRRRDPATRYRGMARVAKLIGTFLCFWVLASFLASGGMDDPLDIVFGMPPGMILLTQLNLVAGALAVTRRSCARWPRGFEGYWSFLGRAGVYGSWPWRALVPTSIGCTYWNLTAL